jgi:hypothetical protein
MTAISVDEFDHLIGTVKHSLWRWEAQPAYHEPDEAEPFARWLAGEPDDLAWLSGWLDQVRTASSAGRRYERVRRLTEPPTDYLRWSLSVAPANIAAGEDVRLLTEHRATALGLPTYDYVIVDDRVVARMEFGDTGFVGARLVDDPATVARHRTWRDLAWHDAITLSANSPRSP